MEDYTLGRYEITIDSHKIFLDMSKRLSDMLIFKLEERNMSLDDLRKVDYFKGMNNIGDWLSAQHDFYVDEIVAIEMFFDVKILNIDLD